MKTNTALAYLIVKSGPNKGAKYEVAEATISIGRDPSKKIFLADPKVSRNHAQVVRRNGSFLLVDLGSTNGTFVNGHAITEQKLSLEDEIKVGRTVLVFTETEKWERGEDPSKLVKILPADSPRVGSQTVAISISGPEAEDPSLRLTQVDLESLEKAHRRLAVLFKVGQAVNSLLDLPTALKKTMELIFEVMDVERGFIMLVDERTGKLVPKVVRERDNLKGPTEIAVSRTIIDEAVQNGKSVLTKDAISDPRFEDQPSVALHQIRSALCVPLKTKERVLGVSYVSNRTSSNCLTKDDLELLTAICQQVANSIENGKLFQNMKEVNELAADTAHLINNPLQIISAGGQLLLKKMEGDAENTELLKKIISQSARAHQMTQELLRRATSVKQLFSPSRPALVGEKTKIEYTKRGHLS